VVADRHAAREEPVVWNLVHEMDVRGDRAGAEVRPAAAGWDAGTEPKPT
jgi:hypothetical protein